MTEQFLPDFASSETPDAAPASTELKTPERETLRVVILGSREAVTETIYELFQRGFAEVGAWSRLLPNPRPGELPVPNAGEVMSILTRYRVIRRG